MRSGWSGPAITSVSLCSRRKAMRRPSPSPSVVASTARKGASSTAIDSFSTGVTRTKLPSGSRRRMVENSRTSAGRPIGVPWWNQVPSAAIRMSLSPQCSGCHCSTGGSRWPATRRAISSSDRRAGSGGCGRIGVAIAVDLGRQWPDLKPARPQAAQAVRAADRTAGASQPPPAGARNSSRARSTGPGSCHCPVSRAEKPQRP